MILPAKILSKWFGTRGIAAKAPMMEALETRQLLSAVLPVTVTVPPFQGAVPAVPMIKTVGETIHAAAGQRYSGVLGEVENIGATAVGAKELENLNDLQAIVTWGDGSSGKGTLSLTSTGTVVISGAHRWEASGKDDLTIVLETVPPVVDPPTALLEPLVIATVDSTAEVVNGRALTKTAGQSFSAVVGYFDFAPAVAGITTTTGGFNVSTTIDWGDGSTSAGTIKEVAPGFYSVAGTHAYAKAGKYTVQVGVTATPAPKGGVEDPIILLVAHWESTIDATGPVIPVVTGPQIHAIARVEFQGEVGFYASPILDPPLQYAATINWGDGVTSAATLSYGASGKPGYIISGTHTYSKAGNYTVETTLVTTPLNPKSGLPTTILEYIVDKAVVAANVTAVSPTA